MNQNNQLIFLAILFVLLTCSGANAYIVSFTPRLSISGEFTDNIYLAGDEDRETDFITIISSGFTTGLEEKKAGVSFSYSPALSYYVKHDDNNTLRHDARASIWSELTKKTRLDLQDSFNRTEESSTEVNDDTDDASPISEGGASVVRRSRSPYNTNNASMRLAHRFGDQSSMLFSYAYQTVINDDQELAADSRSHMPSMNLTYWSVPGNWGFEIDSSLTRGLYDESSADFSNIRGSIRLIKRFSRQFESFFQYNHTKMEYDGDIEEYQIYNPSIGINYVMSQNTTLNIGVGYFIQDREESEDEAGVSMDGNLGKTWRFRHGDLNITGSSGYDESFLDTENLGFSIYYGAALSAGYAFSRKLVGNISSSVRQDRYVNPEPEDLEREDLSGRITTGITWRLESWMFARAELSTQNLDSNIEGNDYMEKRASLIVTMTPSLPFRRVR